MQNDQCFAINHAVDLQALANRISEAIEYHEEGLQPGRNQQPDQHQG
jgi:hypothetical protein